MLQKGSIFEAIDLRALHVPNLVALDLDVCGLPALPTSVGQCYHILSLTRLTSLTVTTAASVNTTMHVFWESVGALTSLRKLHISLQQGCPSGPEHAAAFTIPPSWTALSLLLEMKLLHATWYTNPAALAHLAGLQMLCMHYAAQQLPQILHACVQLPSLTSLTLYDIDEHLQASPQAVRQLSGGSWNSPLQVLELRGFQSQRFQAVTGAELQLFQGLSKLILWGDERNFPDSQMLPLASLQLLRHLELHRITVTVEVCW
jgi:hypothetical protein